MKTRLLNPCPGCHRRIYYANFTEAVFGNAAPARKKGYKRIYGLDRGVKLEDADALFVSTCIILVGMTCPACGAQITEEVPDS